MTVRPNRRDKWDGLRNHESVSEWVSKASSKDASASKNLNRRFWWKDICDFFFAKTRREVKSRLKLFQIFICVWVPRSQKIRHQKLFCRLPWTRRACWQCFLRSLRQRSPCTSTSRPSRRFAFSRTAKRSESCHSYLLWVKDINSELYIQLWWPSFTSIFYGINHPAILFLYPDLYTYLCEVHLQQNDFKEKEKLTIAFHSSHHLTPESACLLVSWSRNRTSWCINFGSLGWKHLSDVFKYFSLILTQYLYLFVSDF